MSLEHRIATEGIAPVRESYAVRLRFAKKRRETLEVNIRYAKDRIVEVDKLIEDLEQTLRQLGE